MTLIFFWLFLAAAVVFFVDSTVANFSKEVQNLKNEITGGIILTGGGALTKGLPELGEYILEMPTKIGYPKSFGGMTNIMHNPKYSTVLGLLLEAARKSDHNKLNKDMEINQADLVSRLSDSLKSVFKEIF